MVVSMIDDNSGGSNEGLIAPSVYHLNHVPSFCQALAYDAAGTLDCSFLSRSPFRDYQTYHVSQVRFQAVEMHGQDINRLPNAGGRSVKE